MMIRFLTGLLNTLVSYGAFFIIAGFPFFIILIFLELDLRPPNINEDAVIWVVLGLMIVGSIVSAILLGPLAVVLNINNQLSELRKTVEQRYKLEAAMTEMEKDGKQEYEGQVVEEKEEWWKSIWKPQKMDD